MFLSGCIRRTCAPYSWMVTTLWNYYKWSNLFYPNIPVVGSSTLISIPYLFFLKWSRRINFYLNSCFKIQHVKSIGLFCILPSSCCKFATSLLCIPFQIHTCEVQWWLKTHWLIFFYNLQTMAWSYLSPARSFLNGQDLMPEFGNKCHVKYMSFI